MSLPENPKKTDGLLAEELEGLDEMIYVRPDNGATFSLNLTAASVLEWCDGSRNPAQIADLLGKTLADALPETQQPDSSRIQQEVNAILADFADKGLIEGSG